MSAKAKITFIDVGQGDTSIVEIQHEGKTYIGIIDCKKYYKNSVIEYLETLSEDYEVEFIITSHMHYDHYSGVIDLLDYLKQKGKLIKSFYTTKGLLEFAKDIPDVRIPVFIKKSHARLNDKIRECVDANMMEAYEFWKHSTSPVGNTGICRNAFAPDIGLEGEQIKVRLKDCIQRKKIFDMYADANCVSSVLSICKEATGHFILFTSDAEKLTFEKLADTMFNPFKKHLHQKMIAAQIPHHGSERNFHEPFWEKMSAHSPGADVVISVGRNRYGHPNLEVCTKLKKFGYMVRRTDVVDDAKHQDKVCNTVKVDHASHALDYVSAMVKHAKVYYL